MMLSLKANIIECFSLPFSSPQVPSSLFLFSLGHPSLGGKFGVFPIQNVEKTKGGYGEFLPRCHTL